MGGLKRSKGGLGGSLIKVRNFQLRYFVIMFEGGGSRIFLNIRRGYPKNRNSISLGSGNFFPSKTFSPPPSPPT